VKNSSVMMSLFRLVLKD